MRKLLLVICISFILLTATGQLKAQKWSNDKYLWEQFKKDVIIPNNNDFCVYDKHIKIQLKGDIIPDDTIFVDELIARLSGLIQRCKIERVKTSGNLIVNFKEFSDSLYFKKHCNNKKVFSKLQALLDSVKLEDIISNKSIVSNYNKALLNNYFLSSDFRSTENQFRTIIKNTINFESRKNIPLAIRHKQIEFYVIRSLIAKIKRQSKDGTSIFQTEFIVLISKYQELDSFYISKAYSRDIHFQIIKKFPGLVWDNFKRKYKDYNYLAYITFCICIVAIFFLVLFKRNVIDAIVNSWETFMIKGMLILQSATLIFIFKLGAEKLFDNNHLSIKGSVKSIIILNIICFLTLNYIYINEKLFNPKNISIPKKLYFQFLASIMPVVVIMIFTYPNITSMSLIGIYGLILVTGRISYSFFTLKTQNTIRQKDIELSYLREMQQKSELQALHSRINPHFLYNSLNSIAGLAKTDAEKTEHMALALSDFCRYAMNKTNDTFATISEECEIAQTYLEIEKTRFGDNLIVEVYIDNEVREVKVPRFLIQPLVENAIKHGVSKITTPGLIKLIVNKQPNGLIIAVYDNGPVFSDNPVNGYGLQSIFDKLEIIYKGEAKMNWYNDPEKYISIFIPVTEN